MMGKHLFYLSIGVFVFLATAGAEGPLVAQCPGSGSCASLTQGTSPAASIQKTSDAATTAAYMAEINAGAAGHSLISRDGGKLVAGALEFCLSIKPKLDAVKLTMEECVVIRYYTWFGSNLLNSVLRGQYPDGEEHNRPVIEALNRALKKLPKYTGKVDRGTKLPEADLAAHQVGSTVLYKGFTSSSIGKGFSKIHRFTIESKSGRDISWIAVHPEENEVLFPSGTKFKVKSRKEHPYGGIRFEMEEVSE